MFFLLSGEGPTDMGVCDGGGDFCDGTSFLAGPMAVMVDFFFEKTFGYSILGTDSCRFLSKSTLTEKAKMMSHGRKSISLPGKKRPRETNFFYRNARALARLAMEWGAEIGDEVVAVLFRDSDGTASADRGLWKDKRKSMIRGFKDEGFGRGVPMIPKPKSEAWLICALKADPYRHCASLEDRSGNDKSPNPLKAELEALMGGPVSREKLSEMVVDGTIDPGRIDMPSFQEFRESLMEAIR